MARFLVQHQAELLKLMRFNSPASSQFDRTQYLIYLTWALEVAELLEHYGHFEQSAPLLREFETLTRADRVHEAG